VTAATGALKLTSDSAAEAFRSYVERFGEVDEQFAKFVANVRDKVQELGGEMNKALHAGDGEMAKAVTNLHRAIADVNEAVQALHDAPPSTPSAG
jgi:ABC-type transporter Mla subunit MlaD